MLAAIFDHVDIARLLIAAGADVRLQDNLGLTAREWAVRRGSSEVAQLLPNALPAEMVPSPKNAPEKQARPKVAADRNPAAEAKITPQQDVLSGTEGQLRAMAEQRSEAEQQRRASVSETKIAPQHDALRWTKFHKRIMGDLERRKAEETRRESATETKIAPQQDAPSVADEFQKTQAEPQSASPIEPKITPQQDAPSVADEQQKTKADLESASPIETKIAPQQDAPSVADEQQKTKAEPERREAEEERSGATQPPAIEGKIEHQRILEESCERVEAEVRAKSQQPTRTAGERGNRGVPSGAARGTRPGISAGLPNPLEGHVDRNVREAPAAEPSPRPAMLEPKTSEPLNPPPIKRCPQCNATYGNALLTYCAFDDTKLISADDSLFNSPAVNDWTRPTLWALIAIIAVLGGSLGYLMNNYLSSEKESSAPIVVQTEQPETPRKDLPMIAGALSGMEVDVPEPEYPGQAKTEGVTGTIAVRVKVNKRGRVISARSSRGDSRLRAAAVKAAQKATFSPEKLAGRGANGTITYVFKL
jgi:TonB family protein